MTSAAVLTPELPLGLRLHLGLSCDLVLSPGVDLRGNIGFTGLILALVVLAAAESFRRGRKLAEDTEGLV